MSKARENHESFAAAAPRPESPTATQISPTGGPPVSFRRTSLALTALLISSLQLAAGGARAEQVFDTWIQAGPEGGRVSSVAVDPAAPERWLAASSNQVLERPGPDSPWRLSSTVPSGVFGEIVFEPGASGRLFAFTRGRAVLATSWAWRSDDGGATWIDLGIPSGPDLDIRDLHASPSGVFFATDLGLLRWREDGWSEVSGENLRRVALSPDGTVGFAVTLTGGGRLLRSLDGGATWQESSGLGARSVQGVAIASGPARRIFASGTETDGTVFTASSADDGLTWSINPGTVFEAPPDLHATSPPGGPAEAILFGATGARTYRSADDGSTWTAVEVGRGAVSQHPFQVVEGSGALIAAGRSGIFSSDDGGILWEEQNRGLYRHLLLQVEMDAERSEHLWVLGTSGEVFATKNGGATWKRLALPVAYGGLTVLPNEPRTLLVGAMNGWYRSTDDGETFTLHQEHADRDNRVHRFSFDPRDPNRVVAAGFERARTSPDFVPRTWWSTDGGRSWRPGPEIDTTPEFRLAERDPFSPGTVYLGSNNGLYRSIDEGESLESLIPQRPQILSLAFDPRREGRLYARMSGPIAFVGFLRSDDGGLTWTLLDPEPPFDVFSQLAPDPRVADRLWAESGAGLWRSDDGGRSWQLASPEAGLIWSFVQDPRFPRTFYAGISQDGLKRITLTDGEGCAHPEILCLSGERFSLESRWRDFGGRRGVGQKSDLTADTGYFWFFSPTNVELVIKVLDGRGFNDHHWVFYGSLSNVEFDLKVTDTASGQVVTYGNPSGSFASVGDTGAFPELSDQLSIRGSGPAPALSKTEGCGGDASTLCLGDRFRLSATWRDFAGNTGGANPEELTTDTGYFTFFGPENVELVVKVLDGRPVNGRYWVFYASLSNVAFELVVEDLETGAVKRYANALGNFASVGDTEAF